MSQTQNATIAVVGIDIGKNSFHIVGHDESGAIGMARRFFASPTVFRTDVTPASFRALPSSLVFFACAQ